MLYHLVPKQAPCGITHSTLIELRKFLNKHNTLAAELIVPQRKKNYLNIRSIFGLSQDYLMRIYDIYPVHLIQILDISLGKVSKTSSFLWGVLTIFTIFRGDQTKYDIVLLISLLPDIIQKCFCTPDAAMDPHFRMKQAQLGVPHSRIQVELGFILQAGTSQILNFAQNPRQSQRV